MTTNVVSAACFPFGRQKAASIGKPSKVLIVRKSRDVPSLGRKSSGRPSGRGTKSYSMLAARFRSTTLLRFWKRQFWALMSPLATYWRWQGGAFQQDQFESRRFDHPWRGGLSKGAFLLWILTRNPMAKIVDWDSRIGGRVRLRDLHILLAVVQSGTMAKAARQLNVSQPAVSEAIASLEHALGVRLLDRSRRGVEPTNYGSALLKSGRAVFDELRHGIKQI